jgi:hypothetical protein
MSDRHDRPGADDPYGDRALVPRPIRSVATPHGWIVADAIAGETPMPPRKQSSAPTTAGA